MTIEVFVEPEAHAFDLRPFTEKTRAGSSVHARQRGTRVVTASNDKTAQVWTLSIDMGSLDEWLLLRCSPFAFSNTVLIAQPAPLRVCTAIATSAALR